MILFLSQHPERFQNQTPGPPNKMSPKTIHTAIVCLILATTLIRPQDGLAQSENRPTQPATDTFDIRTRSFLLPLSIKPGSWVHALSFTYVDLPSDWTLNQLNEPMLTYSAKLGLPLGFTFQAGLSTLAISNRLAFGPFWNYSVGHMHFGVGWQAGYILGVLNAEGYNTRFTGWDQEPTVIIGHSFKRFALTLKGNLTWTNSVQFSEAGHNVPIWGSFLNGYAVSAGFEQRLYRSKVLQVGFKISSIRYHFLAWPAFPVNESRNFVPEFHLGINL